MAAHGDLCWFCVEKIIPYSVCSSDGEGEVKFGSDNTPPHSSPSFKKLCDILQVVITDELLKGPKGHPSFVGDESCEKFLCLTCFESAEKLSKLYQELELIQKKIEDGTRSIRNLITGKIGKGLAEKRGSKKKKSSSLVFIEAFQKLVKESPDFDSGHNALVSATPDNREHGDANSLEAAVPTKRPSSRNKRAILVQADENDHQNDDVGANEVKADVKLEVDQEDGFDEFSDYFPNEDITSENDSVGAVVEEGQDSVTQGTSRAHIDDDECEIEIEQKFVPPSEVETVKKGGRKRINAESRSLPKKKRKRVNAQCQEFKCRDCTATFQSSFQYYSHRKSHAPVSSKSLDITTIYKAGSQTQIEARICPICDKRINGYKVGKFMEHTLSHEITLETLPNQTLLSCKKCDKKFFIKLNLDLHKICEHEWRHIILKCDICQDFSHKTREDLIAHLKTHKEDTPIHLCKSCPMACTTLDKLLNHMVKHANSKRLSCPECDHFVTPTIKELYYHCQKVHSELKQTFECEFCKKPFLVPASLRNHMRECQGDGAGGLICDQCPNGKVFKTKSLLQRHIEYMHGDDGTKPFNCDKCPKCFKYKHLLQQHIDKKHDNIRYPCPICAKSYCNQSQLNYHIKTHTGEDLFTCDVCGQQFPRIQQLKIHSLVHSEKTEEICDVCGKVFGNPLNLRKHKYTHNDKSLECKYCQIKFGRSDHLKSHLRTHTGERPFVCPVCEKGFNRKDIMIVHMGMHGYSKEEASKVYKQHEETGLK